MSAAALDPVEGVESRPQWHALDALCTASLPVLEDWLSDQQSLYPGTPRDTAAAFLFGTITWALCEMIAARWLEAGRVPVLPPGPLRLAMQREHWQEDGEEGEHFVCRIDLVWSESGDRPEAVLVGDLARALHGRLASLAATLSQCAGLPASALWRLLGDAIGGAFLGAAPDEDTGAARAAASALLAASAAPIRNRQLQFEEIVLPAERHPRGERVNRWFRKRGGCCRYYKVEGGDYCTTCVLRDDESRRGRLLDYVERQCRIAAEAGSS